MKVYLIRHGETTGDIENRYGGSFNDHLTEKGQEQIKATAQRLVGKEIELILSSPLIRASETAQIIKNVIKVPVEYIDGLRERHYGVLSGLTKEEANQKYPEAVKLHEDYKNTDPEGESYEDFYQRVTEAFKSITEKDYKTIALTIHSGPIKVIYRSLGKGELSKLNDGHILELDI